MPRTLLLASWSEANMDLGRVAKIQKHSTPRRHLARRNADVSDAGKSEEETKSDN